MTVEYDAKIFRSGNSVALRLPAALGLRAGETVKLRQVDGTFSFEAPGQPARKILGDWIGSMPDLQPLDAGQRAFDERALDEDGAELTRDDE